VTTQVNKTAAESLNVCLQAGNFEFKDRMLNSKSTQVKQTSSRNFPTIFEGEKNKKKNKKNENFDKVSL
jgi:hypothetical protein